MSFPPLRTSSPQSLSSAHRIEATLDPEAQPLIQNDANAPDDKQEVDNQIGFTTAPDSPFRAPLAEDAFANTEGSIRLESPEDLQVRQSWTRPKLPGYFRDIRPENRGILDDMGRGLMIIATTPIAFVGMTLYTCGMMIEGIALMLKGVGSLGGRVLMRRRRSVGAQSPDPQWV